MRCEDAGLLLEAYFDNEVGPPHLGEVERHLQQCAACRAALAELTELRAALRTHAPYHRAPHDLAGTLRATLPAVEPTPAMSAPSRASVGRYAALAMALVLAAAAGAWLAHPDARSMLEDELVAAHARSLLSARATDVASSDRHTVKPWFSGKLDFSPAVYDLAAQGFPLTGARIDYVGRRPVAVLVYRRHQHAVNLFVWPMASGEAPAKAARQGYNLLHWTRAGLAYWAVSDLNAAELAEMRDMLLQAVD